MRPVTITQTPAAASATKVAASQSPGAGAITLAATASALDTGTGGRIVSLVSGGDDSGITFTITGVDQNGLAATEAVTGANTGTAVSTKFYQSVSSITHTGSVAGTLTAGIVGTTLSTSSPLVLLDFYDRIATVVAVETTGTINFTVKETFDPVLAGTVTPSAAILFSPSALSAKTSSTVAQLDVGATGVCVVINSYSTGATLVARVISPANSNMG